MSLEEEQFLKVVLMRYEAETMLHLLKGERDDVGVLRGNYLKLTQICTSHLVQK